jgi:signal transduction histidine kinase
LASEPRGFSDLDDPSTKLLVVPIERSGTRVGSIVGGVRLESYETTESAALFGSIALAAAVLAAMGLLVWWVLRAALHPVARMTTLAGEWSHEAPGERFGLGDPRDELTRLGATLDGLLDRVSAGVRRERRLSAEIAHELKTPVSRIAAEAELALASASAIDAETSEALRAIRNETRRITRTIDALVRSAEGQSEGTRGTSSTADVVADVVTAFEGSVRGRRVSIETSSVAPETIGVDADLAAQILAPVVQNAIQYARRRVVIGARRRGLSIEVSVDDDGPGLSADETEAVFEPGWRGSAATSSRHSGAGLGLPLSRRLARGVDAEIVADTDAVGGRFLIRFPPG